MMTVGVGDVVGSQCAAPEVVQGKGYGENVDVWALGVTFYALLTGRFPFGGGSRTADNPPEVFHRIVHQRLSLPDAVRRVVSCRVSYVVCGI
jgi:serine/threonine protein kinase